MQPKVDKPPRVLRMPHVSDRVGLSKSSIFALIADGKFPRGFPLTPNGRAVGWLECDVDEYILARREAARGGNINFPTHDTDWALSANGNYWRRIDGTALIVGERKDGNWWARRGDTSLRGSFPSKHAAMAASEAGLDTTNRPDNNNDGGVR